MGLKVPFWRPLLESPGLWKPLCPLSCRATLRPSLEQEESPLQTSRPVLVTGLAVLKVFLLHWAQLVFGVSTYFNKHRLSLCHSKSPRKLPERPFLRWNHLCFVSRGNVCFLFVMVPSGGQQAFQWIVFSSKLSQKAQVLLAHKTHQDSTTRFGLSKVYTWKKEPYLTCVPMFKSTLRVRFCLKQNLPCIHSAKSQTCKGPKDVGSEARKTKIRSRHLRGINQQSHYSSCRK